MLAYNKSTHLDKHTTFGANLRNSVVNKSLTKSVLSAPSTPLFLLGNIENKGKSGGLGSQLPENQNFKFFISGAEQMLDKNKKGSGKPFTVRFEMLKVLGIPL